MFVLAGFAGALFSLVGTMRVAQSKYSRSDIDVADSVQGASIARKKLGRTVLDRIRGLVGIPLADPCEIDILRQTIETQRARIADLERLADEDVLAPVANRRAFERELARQLAHDARHSTSSAVIYFDLDGLKTVNDRHGHAAGDAAITRVADVLSDSLRDSDLVARLGGDEFGVLLPRAEITAARDKAQLLAHRVQASPLNWNGAVIPLSVSHGVHALTGGEPARAALDAADRAMYVRKRLRTANTAAR